jgi:hypothetical protein
MSLPLDLGSSTTGVSSALHFPTGQGFLSFSSTNYTGGSVDIEIIDAVGAFIPITGQTGLTADTVYPVTFGAPCTLRMSITGTLTAAAQFSGNRAEDLSI